MSYQIKVAASDITFDCNDGESVLDAAERAGFALPYSCRKGVCSECQGGVINAQGITEKALLCCVRPSANVTIAPRKIEKRERVVRKKLDASVFRIAQAAPDVTVLQLRLPTGVRAKFRAGQYLQIHLDDETVRNYSMANPPHQSDSVHLHVRHVAGGRFSDGVLKELAVGKKLRIELPYGEFFFRDESAKPVILVATGTGFAPVKSIVEDAIKRKLARPMKLYWGARRSRTCISRNSRANGTKRDTSSSFRCCPTPKETGRAARDSCIARCWRIIRRSRRIRSTHAAIRR